MLASLLWNIKNDWKHWLVRFNLSPLQYDFKPFLIFLRRGRLRTVGHHSPIVASRSAWCDAVSRCCTATSATGDGRVQLGAVGPSFSKQKKKLIRRNLLWLLPSILCFQRRQNCEHLTDAFANICCVNTKMRIYISKQALFPFPL